MLRLVERNSAFADLFNLPCKAKIISHTGRKSCSGIRGRDLGRLLRDSSKRHMQGAHWLLMCN